MKTIQINEIEGFQIGSAQDTENATGCTVILCKEGATAGGHSIHVGMEIFWL